ncbi:MAG: chemotaxis protein CheW [Phycisphaerae bacterium]|nr:chemotaxis protein CheW [Phycisphaerae bacterium]
MINKNDELVASYIEEANETLADFENDILIIEEAGANIDIELVNKVFRGIHSMKGSAGFLGLVSIGSLAHEAENVLNLIRNNELVPTSKVADALLRAADCLRGMTNNIDTSNDVDVTEFVNLLQVATTEESTPEVRESLNRDVDIALPTGGLAFVMIKEMELVMWQKQGFDIYVVSIDFFTDIHDKNLTPIDFYKRTNQHGNVVSSYMSTAGIGELDSELPDSMNFVMLFASMLAPADLAQAIGVPESQVSHIATSMQTNWEPSGPKEPSGSVESETQTSAPVEACPVEAIIPASQPVSPKPKNNKPDTVIPTSSTPASTNLRVNVKVLDRLMNLAGELVLGRNQLLQEASDNSSLGMESVANRIDQVTSELQDAIMQTRMQAIGTVFNKFPRIVRDLSSQLGKECELTIDGKDVEMDKTIIEAIGDPLTHLIRNSVDHGIEDPATRKQRRKSPSGTIKLKAYHQAGKVNISISDDGGGIDGEKLKEKALERGIITSDQAADMTHREAVKLIFHPGFSMAKVVSDVSGRGVGMDVVRTNIEEIGGTVEVDTEVGVGTTIVVKLPLTLAIMPSLVLRCGQDRFAIPQVNISELVRIKASNVATTIEKIKNIEVLRLRGKLLPLVRLSNALGITSQFYDRKIDDLEDNQRAQIADRRSGQEPVQAVADLRSGQDRRENTVAGALNIIVVESGHFHYGLIVDELFDNKEIVVKPLGKHLKDCVCLAGATILGDGMVALILDVAGIASHLNLIMPDTEQALEDKARADSQDSETQSTLVFANDPEEFFGVPVEFISRIERIRASQIDSVGGQDVLQYRGSSLPLLHLADHARCKPEPEAAVYNVIVFKISGKEIGLVASNLVDISELPVHIDTVTFRQTGIIGSTIQNEKAIRLIDVFELTEAAHPEWFTQRETTESKENKSNVILFAEDSSFFRQQVTNFLQSEGYEVVACEDGQIAWDTLQDPEHQFGLVVTDIEMPNMDGLELARNIKSDPMFAHLPVIAVTSLAGQDDIEKGMKIGIDDYQVKLDRDMLLAAIAKHLKAARLKSGVLTNSEKHQIRN